MLIDNKYINDEEVVASQDSFIKKINNIFITQEQINILKNYKIDINNYNNLNELIYDIEEYLNDSYDNIDDLEWVSQSLAEFNYYNNTNK